MQLIFTTDPQSGVPLYLQLVEQVKRAVALGRLSPGEQLPTVKALALSLTLNPNTVARAYRDLERAGVIMTRQGRGSFVRADGLAGSTRQAAADVAAGILSEAVREIRALGLDRAAALATFEGALTRWYRG